MATVREKILAILSKYSEIEISAEDIFIFIRSELDDKIRITTLTRELYSLVKSGVVMKTGNGLYVLGDYRTSELNWLTELRES